MTLGATLRRQIYADFIWVIAPEDRVYFRQSREALLGMTLEAYSATRDEALAEFTAACAPLERTLSEQGFIAGRAPAYADYAVFSLFQWARIGSPRDLLADRLPAIRAWRSRLVALFDHLGDRFPPYPTERSGPDGRATQPRLAVGA